MLKFTASSSERTRRSATLTCVFHSTAVQTGVMRTDFALLLDSNKNKKQSPLPPIIFYPCPSSTSVYRPSQVRDQIPDAVIPRCQGAEHSPSHYQPVILAQRLRRISRVAHNDRNSAMTEFCKNCERMCWGKDQKNRPNISPASIQVVVGD
ncbi:hypothetical protein CONLIGDRAFT_137588 [Coniochaeta ligniaria NRRL 30616]|uniref:Uncharacterized protein n=1 Tax=Coniochaeta ligniaria NRRL 30616 TaxID=1408157 RepID=A0A1J7I7L4_9PEZI|nr:hypothetical protein CONLIGDRAFT_137588 [Coniochaeta ligniaria NRRL 30616]